MIEKYLIREPKEYSESQAREICEWVKTLYRYAEEERKKRVDTSKWDKIWEFIRGNQWDSAFPSYRRPIVSNKLRRTLNILISVLTGGRPIIKIVPNPVKMKDPLTQQEVPDKEYLESVEMLQHAVWAIWRNENISRKYAQALLWALTCNGGWLKVSYGKRAPFVEEYPDVIVECIHPKKIYIDPECTDPTLTNCSFIIYKDVFDLSHIAMHYPDMARYVEPEEDVSYISGDEDDRYPSGYTIAPAGNWVTNGKGVKRARVTVYEVWIDDPSLEAVYEEEVVGVDVNTGLPLKEKRFKEWRPKYPYGRLITCTEKVVLRDIPNPYGEAFGHKNRWPFVYIQGSEDVNPIYAPGVLSTTLELQHACNRTLQLLLENVIKFTAQYIVADENAMDDDTWNMLALMPGVKIRKAPSSEFRIESPPPLPAYALEMPDYFGRKIEEEVGLQDPPLPAGQAVAAKTIELLQQKGNFLLGLLAKIGDEALERLGERIVGLIVSFYEEGRPIPYFDGEEMKEIRAWHDLPDSLQYRVDASSAWTEILAAMQQQAMVEAMEKKLKKR